MTLKRHSYLQTVIGNQSMLNTNTTTHTSHMNFTKQSKVKVRESERVSESSRNKKPAEKKGSIVSD